MIMLGEYMVTHRTFWFFPFPNISFPPFCFSTETKYANVQSGGGKKGKLTDVREIGGGRTDSVKGGERKEKKVFA